MTNFIDDGTSLVKRSDKGKTKAEYRDISDLPEYVDKENGVGRQMIKPVEKTKEVRSRWWGFVGGGDSRPHGCYVSSERFRRKRKRVRRAQSA